ncbi:MAG: transposase, partial [Pararhodobacter sp.]
VRRSDRRDSLRECGREKLSDAPQAVGLLQIAQKPRERAAMDKPGIPAGPIRFFMSAGQVSDYTGAAALLDTIPQADWLLADRGYDADWLGKALQDRGIKAGIPGRNSRKKTVKYDKRRYKRRNRIEIMFGRLKDWRRVATRCDR